MSKQKKLLGMVSICPIGSRGGMDNLFFGKSVFVKHPTHREVAVSVEVGGVVSMFNLTIIVFFTIFI